MGFVLTRWLVCCAAVFALATGVARAKEAIDHQAEEMIWQGIRDQKDPKYFRLFLDKYPDSAHVDEARKRLDQIQAIVGKTWRGFKLLKDAALPKTIDKKRIRETVFLISTFEPTEKPEIVDVSKLKKDPLRRAAIGSIAYYRGMQLKSCMNQKIRFCPIGEPISGTAFAVDNPSTMVTARHVLGSWAAAVVKANPDQTYGSILSPFLLQNSRNEIIYNSVTSKQTARLAFWNQNWLPDRFINWTVLEDNQLYMQADYLELKFSQPVFRDALRRSNVDINAANTSLYALGFPDLVGFFRTNKREGKRDKNLVNGALVATAGSLLRQGGTVYETEAYAFNGMSGGPLLNVDGEVVGVMAALSDDRGAKHGRFERSYFVTTNKTTLNKVWAQMQGRQFEREAPELAAKIAEERRARREAKVAEQAALEAKQKAAKQAAEKAAREAARMAADPKSKVYGPPIALKPWAPTAPLVKPTTP